ncbi:MAG: CRISPR-associated endonuclease Cas1 [Thaumarchaeota archaeon]|nr:CRISPR-associated endonuclease Cas1 [Nitrososphaerota archaeon]
MPRPVTLNKSCDIRMNVRGEPCIVFDHSFKPIADDVHSVVVFSQDGLIEWSALRALAERDVFIYGVGIEGKADWTIVPKSYTIQGKLRLNQYGSIYDPGWHMTIARAFVDCKVAADAKMLHLAGLRDSPDPPQPAKPLDTMMKIRLWEGACAKEHFEALGRFFRKNDLKFEGREQKHHQNRAAKQLSNAMLNYCYGICQSFSRKAVLQTALDPTLGWLHRVGDNLEAGVYDAQELIRFLADACVINLVRRGDHYNPDGWQTRWDFTIELKKPLIKAIVFEMTRLFQIKAPFERDARPETYGWTYEHAQMMNLERITRWIRSGKGELKLEMKPVPELFTAPVPS